MIITEEMIIEYNRELKKAIESIYNELNQGQQKKLLKNENIKALFDRYKIKY